MEESFIGVREVNTEIFRKFKALAVAKKMKLGDALTKLMQKAIKEEREAQKTKPDPKNLKKITGIIKTKEKVKWSEEIDNILYGQDDIS